MIEDMRTHMKAYVGAILLMLLFFGVMGMNALSEGNYGEGTRSITQPQQMIYINGDWNVTTDTIRSNETIVLSGNLTVSNNASLTFKNVTLIMNCTDSAQWKIDIRNGSTFRILDLDGDNTTTADASVLNSSDPSYNFLFLVREQANFEMRNSEMHNCGGGYIAWQWNPLAPSVAWYGMCILTDNATIDHNLISYNRYGIVLYGSDAKISNNTITWNDRTGIEATVYSNATIENNWITWNGVYGIDINGWDNTNGPWPSNPLVIGNVVTDTGQGNPGGVGITVDYSSNPIIKDTVILRSTEDGFFSGEGSTPTLINVTIDAQKQGNYGIASSATRYIYIINSTITNAILQDFSIAGAPGSFFVVTNSTFNKVWIDGYGNLTVRWYLHVYVEDNSGIPIPAADVRVRDNENGTYDKNFSTDGNGYVKWIILTEYWQNSTTKIYYTPYNITVSYGNLNFSNNPRNSTMNESKTEIFTATGPLPEFDSVVIPVMIALFIGLAAMNGRRKKKTY